MPRKKYTPDQLDARTHRLGQKEEELLPDIPLNRQGDRTFLKAVRQTFSGSPLPGGSTTQHGRGAARRKKNKKLQGGKKKKKS